MDKELQLVSTNCHTCSSLAKLSHPPPPASTSVPPSRLGTTFAADVIKCNRQLILLLRETVSSLTSACLVESEKAGHLRDGLIQLCVPLRPLDGPPALIRVDPGPGFNSLKDDKLLMSQRIRVEVGESKNKNKNPIAEKAVQELFPEYEIRDSRPEKYGLNVTSLTTISCR